MSVPRISLIVPAYNEAGYLPALLDSAARAADRFERERGRRVETVVADNASTDDTARVALSRGARVVREPHRQIAAARNAGARAARGEILVTCDADNVVSENLFTRIDETLSSRRYLAGGVDIRPERRRLDTDLLYGGFGWAARALGLAFGAIYTDRETFWRVGGFPSDVYVGEDALFVLRLKAEARRRGLGFACLRDAFITTSLRKVDRYGFWPVLWQHLRYAAWPLHMRRRETCPLWYDVRPGEKS